jgi:hypothetical protein
VVVRFEEETVEDKAGRLHRVGCTRLTFVREAARHEAGTSVDRRHAPAECWACHPAVEIVHGA